MPADEKEHWVGNSKIKKKIFYEKYEAEVNQISYDKKFTKIFKCNLSLISISQKEIFKF